MTKGFARTTLLAALANDIKDVSMSEGLPSHQASQQVIAQRLGYDLDEIEFVDGSGDRGIDFWYTSGGGVYLYQVKTHDLAQDGDINVIEPFDGMGVADLSKAYNLIVSRNHLSEGHRLEKLLRRIDYLARNYKSRESKNPLQVYFSLIVLGERLTEQAFDELAEFEKTLAQGYIFQGIPVEFFVDLKTIDDLLKEAWREDNYEWYDVNGERRDSIRLTPLRQARGERDYLNDNKSAIFYSKAVDLIKAYEDFGYQRFEPNVRANIKNSPVNNAIQESASHDKSMKEFRFLNNGITIICSSYKKPVSRRPEFEITKPGVVNGLQTVTSLSTAYGKLSDNGRESFSQNCYVLVRLLQENAMSEISDVAMATNNQNSMQPRNLVSNSAEQNHFAQFFAERLGSVRRSKARCVERLQTGSKTLAS